MPTPNNKIPKVSLLFKLIVLVVIFIGIIYLVKITKYKSSQPNTAAEMQVKNEPVVNSQAKEWKKIEAEQLQVEQVVESQPLIKPIVGIIQTRPEFVSATEWNILQALSENSQNPDKELNRLVNSLRFNKLLEHWKNSSISSDQTVNSRPETLQVLADQLLQELPDHLKQGQISEQEVRELQKKLLKDAEPDPEQREQRAIKESSRVNIIINAS